MSIITCRSHRSRERPPVFSSSCSENLFSYIGGSSGSWRITQMQTLSGPALRLASHVEIAHGPVVRPPGGASWILSGIARNTRFVTREERSPEQCWSTSSQTREATCAALIPIQQSAAWWDLAHDEREEIIETQSRCLSDRLRFLTTFARRFLFGRDLGEPFDIVTWLEYSPCDEALVNDLAAALRQTQEWKYVEREIDIRMVRET